jgi:cobalamin biosynthesis protein CobT
MTLLPSPDPNELRQLGNLCNELEALWFTTTTKKPPSPPKQSQVEASPVTKKPPSPPKQSQVEASAGTGSSSSRKPTGTKTKAKKHASLIHGLSEKASRQDPATNGCQAAAQLADAMLAGYYLADDCGIEYHLRWQDEVQAFILAAESLEQIPKTNHTKTVISSLTAIANGLLRCIKDDDKKRARFLHEFPDYNFDSDDDANDTNGPPPECKDVTNDNKVNGSDQEEKEDSADEDDPSYDTDDVQEEQVDTAEFEEDEDDKVNNSDEEENKDSASEDAALVGWKYNPH